MAVGNRPSDKVMIKASPCDSAAKDQLRHGTTIIPQLSRLCAFSEPSLCLTCSLEAMACKSMLLTRWTNQHSRPSTSDMGDVHALAPCTATMDTLADLPSLSELSPLCSTHQKFEDSEKEAPALSLVPATLNIFIYFGSMRPP